MKKLSMLAVPLLTALFTLAPANAAAQANSYQDNAVQALQNSQVYVESSVSLSDESSVENALQGSDIAVAVLPSLAVDSLAPADFGREILSGTPYATLILILEDNARPFSVVYKSTPSEESARAVYTTLSDNGNDIDKALVPIIEQLKTGENSASPSGSTGSDSESGGSRVLNVLFSLFTLILVVVVMVVAFKLIRRKSFSAKRNHAAPLGKVAESVPTKLHALIKQLDDLASKHSQLAHDDSLASDLRTIVRNVQELFTRLSKKGTNGQRGIAEVEYVDKLTKLNEALGANYYLDIIEHPELWDNFQERLKSVASAASAVKSQLIENIKQVNASKDLEFQVVLESLLASANAVTLKDIYKPDLRKEKE